MSEREEWIKMQQKEKNGTWKGRYLDDMSKGELIEALKELGALYGAKILTGFLDRNYPDQEV